MKTNKTKVYHVDIIIEEYSLTFLQLPAYHTHLNHIELVWAKVKGPFAEQNRSFKMCDVEVLTCVPLKSRHSVLEEEVQPLTIINLLE
jgi:hypothetical protein